MVSHAGLAKNLAKACSCIVEALPRANLGLILYPTPAIREAVARLYAAIVKFALRALRWYQQGRLMHIASTIASPWALGFEEEFAEIERNSNSVEELAQSAARAELRELRFQVHQSRSDQQQARTELLQLKNTVEDGFRNVTEHFLGRSLRDTDAVSIHGRLAKPQREQQCNLSRQESPTIRLFPER